MSRRLSLPGLYALALASLLFMGWTAWRLARHPDAGVTWSFTTGLVATVDPAGPAAGRLRPGDHVLTIDGLPPQQTLFYPNKQAGDVLVLQIQRNDESRMVTVKLVPPKAPEIVSRLSPLMVALVFWGLGAVILAFNASLLGVLFYLFCGVSAAALAAGAASPIGPLWTIQLFNCLLWWLGALIVHFHLHFPASIPSRHPLGHYLPIGLYGLSAFGGALDLAVDPLALRTGVPALYVLRRLWLTGSLFLAVLLLVWAYRSAASAERRRQVGVVALGGVLSLVPFITFSLLPDALLRQPLWPYEWSFLFLSLLPLAYGYAILHYRLIPLDRFVSRGAASALVLALLSGLYLILSAVLMRLAPVNLLEQPVINLAMILALAVAFHPLHRLLYTGVSRIFYGGWYDYRSAVQKISVAIDCAADPTRLAQTVSHEIQAAMQLEGTCLLLPEVEPVHDATTLVCQLCSRAGGGPLRLEMGASILQYFRNDPRPVEAERLRRALAGPCLHDRPGPCLTCPHARLWLPLPGRECPLGILILGAKRGGDAFNSQDREILDVVARQAGVAFQNARLVSELERRAQESEQLHRQVVRAREDERKRVARELHDQIIQPLFGLNYQLAARQVVQGPAVAGSEDRVKAEIRRLVDEVRRICADLRPPALDTLGLASAVRARVREAGQQASFQARLTVEGDEERELPEDVSMCLYWVLQEALLNVQKHAAAREVRVRLSIGPEEVTLTVEDDGRGFDSQAQLGQFATASHFGLAGLRERLSLVDGRLEISSVPRRGTRLAARVPLDGHSEGEYDHQSDAGRRPPDRACGHQE